MVSKKVTVTSAQGLHMRPAGVLVRELAGFESRIMINYGNRQINAKSIMNIIAAGIRCGSELEIVCEGVDEQEAAERAAELIESGLGE